MKNFYCPNCGSIIKYVSNFCHDCGFDILGYVEKNSGLRERFIDSDLLIFFEKMAEMEPENSHAHFSKGIALLMTGRYRESIPAFERVIELDSGQKEVIYREQ